MIKPVKTGQTIAVWFSCGAASYTALKLTLEKYPECKVLALNNPIKEEDEDNQRFLNDAAEKLGVKIISVLNNKYPDASCVDVWNDRSYMSGVGGAPCTGELKKKARQQWEKDNHVDWHVLGFTVDEKKRHSNFVAGERENLLPVLIDSNMTKGDCYKVVELDGLELPRIYKQGYPNANCIGCVKATSPTYWNHVRKIHPDVFQERAEQSERIGAKLVRVKGERILLKDLDPSAKGRPMKDMDFECGIFCEELK